MNKKNKTVQKSPDKVVIYTRNTFKNRPEGYRQRRSVQSLKEECEKAGREVSKIYYELSSKDMNNPTAVLKQMLKDAIRSPWGTVIVSDVETLSRDGAELQLIERELAEYGVQLISEYEPFDTTTEEGLQVFERMCNLFDTKDMRMAALQDIPLSVVASWKIQEESGGDDSIAKLC